MPDGNSTPVQHPGRVCRARSMTRLTVVIPVLCTVLIGACSDGGRQANMPDGMDQTTQVASGGYRNISVAELQAMLEKKDFPLINVHVPFEGDLPGTDATIPFDRITQHLDRLPADRNATIVLYCRSDRMSHEAAAKLARLGYTGVHNLTGGFLAWRAAGLPLEGL
jgi:rhodanese-related sulfurtransferase